MDTLIDVLQMDTSDSEMVGYAVDTLYNVLSPEAAEEGMGRSIYRNVPNLCPRRCGIF